MTADGDSLRTLRDKLVGLEIEAGLLLQRLEAALLKEAPPADRLRIALAKSEVLRDEVERLQDLNTKALDAARRASVRNEARQLGELGRDLRRNRQWRQRVTRPGKDDAP